MNEYTGILTRETVIRKTVSYNTLKTDDQTISLVCFDIAQLARQNLANLTEGSYVTVRGNWQKNKSNGQDELVVTYVAPYEEHATVNQLTKPTVTELPPPVDRITRGVEAVLLLRSLTLTEHDEVKARLKEMKNTQKDDMPF